MLRVLEIAIAVLIAFWALGLVFRLLGALIHIALVVAIILIIVRVIQGASRTA